MDRHAMTHHGEVLSVSPYPDVGEAKPGTGQRFLLQVEDKGASYAVVASLSLMDRMLTEKSAVARERQLEEVVDFMTSRLLQPPTPVELQMAQKLAERHARVLNEFGFFSAEELADGNRSDATNRAALADNWRKRRQVFCVAHPDKKARGRDVYPAFQFDGFKPLKVVQQVLAAFGGRKTPWAIALWFTSNNGWLPDSARPVDLLRNNPSAVLKAAQVDAKESAA